MSHAKREGFKETEAVNYVGSHFEVKKSKD